LDSYVPHTSHTSLTPVFTLSGQSIILVLTISFQVGGSDLNKQQEQLGTPSIPVTSLFDFCFPENGLTAYRLGVPLPSNSFIQWLGEEKYQKLANFCLRYVADLDLPKKRGTFVEFRNGMINVSPIGRNASIEERNEYEKYDKENGIRAMFVEALKKEFPEFGLTYTSTTPTSYYIL